MGTGAGDSKEGWRATIWLAKGARALAIARGFAAKVAILAGQDALADDVALLASELITNALVHGAEPVALTVRVSGDRIRVEVEDTAVALPKLRLPTRDAEQGHGLAIVSGLADKWGTDRVPDDGKVVWAELRDDDAD